MALNRNNGVFSETMFHPTVFDTGAAGRSRAWQKEKYKYDLYRHARLEDEEIVEFILAVTTSGILED